MCVALLAVGNGVLSISTPFSEYAVLKIRTFSFEFVGQIRPFSSFGKSKYKGKRRTFVFFFPILKYLKKGREENKQPTIMIAKQRKKAKKQTKNPPHQKRYSRIRLREESTCVLWIFLSREFRCLQL